MADSHSESPQRNQQPDRESSPRQDNELRSSLNNESTCLYIGNIDKKVDNAQFKEIFEKYGQLEYCFLVYEPSSSDRHRDVKISRGYGFAKFTNVDDLIKAKNELDGYEINGRKIKIEFSKRNKPREETPGRYLGKKRDSPRRHSGGHRHRRRSYSRSSSDSYDRRRRYERREKSKRRYDRSRSRDRERERDRDGDSRRRRRSYSYDRSPRRKD